jgi:UPF0176 protein
MNTLNIAGYKFIPLQSLETLREQLLSICTELKGTILLSHEGINISLAGAPESIQAFQSQLRSDERFTDMRFHETYSTVQPFKRLKIKLKKEIITMRQPDANPLVTRAPSVSPHELKQWLDEKRDVTLLDTRNDYEIAAGTFTGAVNLKIDDFSDLPEAIETLERDKPIVMFCTGGIRCEKAALYMLNQGYDNVYQLDGGILGYFKQVGGEHYEGECFVFDERGCVDTQLLPSKISE